MIIHQQSIKSCPKCNISSHTEERIAYILNTFRVDFQRQYRYTDCKDKRCLPFDFAIMKGSNVLGLIEYDGVHHFKVNETRGGKESFDYTKRHDSIKNEYCRMNKVPLLRIPYFNGKIENTVKNYLESINAI